MALQARSLQGRALRQPQTALLCCRSTTTARLPRRVSGRVQVEACHNDTNLHEFTHGCHDRHTKVSVCPAVSPGASQFCVPAMGTEDMLAQAAYPGDLVEETSCMNEDEYSYDELDKAAADLIQVKEEAEIQREMLAVYQEVVASITEDYKDVLRQQLAERKAAAASQFALQASSVQLTQDLESVRAELEQQKAQVALEREQKQCYKQQLRAAAAELDHLRQSLSAAEHTVPEAPDVAAQQELQQELAHARSELSDVQEQLSAIRAENEAMAGLLCTAEEEHAYAAKAEALQHTVTTTQQQLEDVSTERDSLRDELHAARVRVQDLEKDLVKSNAARVAAEQRNQDVQHDLHRAVVLVTHLRSLSGHLTDQVRDLQSQNKMLMAQLTAAEDHNASVSAELSRTSSLMRNLQHLELELEDKVELEDEVELEDKVELLVKGPGRTRLEDALSCAGLLACCLAPIVCAIAPICRWAQAH